MNENIIFQAAANYVILFGLEYKGQSLDKIAQTDKGLKYLDWLRDQTWVYPETKEMLEIYLGDKTIQKELERILDD